MNRIKLGIRLESLAPQLRPALAAAARLGVAGVQFDAAVGLSPDNLSQTGRRELQHMLRSHNLALTALGCPLRHGLDVAENQQPRIEYVQKVMALSFELGARLVLVEAGRVPNEAEEKANLPRSRRLAESLQTLAAQGDRTGVTLALTVGNDSGAALRAYLNRFDTGSLGVNYDPASFLMNGFDPYDGLRALQGTVVHAHARDARVAKSQRRTSEVAVGHGDVDWLQLLSAFEEVDYRGWLAVATDTGENGAADAANSVAFLRRLLPEGS